MPLCPVILTSPPLAVPPTVPLDAPLLPADGPFDPLQVSVEMDWMPLASVVVPPLPPAVGVLAPALPAAPWV